MHTPGPWSVGGKPSLKIWSGYKPGHGDVIAEVWRSGEVNANLIASAPELFEALSALIDDFGDANGPLIDKAKAALAKARGETTI